LSFLLDTNVLSEYVKPLPEQRVLAWLSAADESDLFVSVVTLAELRFGIERLVDGRKKVHLAEWLSRELIPRFEDRILNVDLEVADAWGHAMASSEADGRKMDQIDCLLGATALVWDLTLVTRNTSHFAGSRWRIFSPWTQG
jgi:toxin FitB